MGQLVNSSIVQGNSNNGLFNRGIKSGNHLFVLRYNNSIPSIQVETGFIDNKKDVALLNNPDFQNKMAEAIAQGIILYKNSDDFRRTVPR
jgi:N-acetylmuramoyl-L-alanine amidase